MTYFGLRWFIIGHGAIFVLAFSVFIPRSGSLQRDDHLFLRSISSKVSGSSSSKATICSFLVHPTLFYLDLYYIYKAQTRYIESKKRSLQFLVRSSWTWAELCYLPCSNQLILNIFKFTPPVHQLSVNWGLLDHIFYIYENLESTMSIFIPNGSAHSINCQLPYSNRDPKERHSDIINFYIDSSNSHRD